MKFAFRATALAVAACTAAPAQADFSFSPRFFLYFDNAYQRSSGFDDVTTGLAAEDADLSQQLTDAYGTPVTVLTHNVTAASINNQQVYPLFGAAVTADLDSAKRTQLTLSALYGKANGDMRLVQTFNQDFTVMGFTARDLVTTNLVGKVEAKRLDLELSLQHRLNERFALLGGLRYERIEAKGTVDFQYQSSNNAANVFSVLFGDSSLILDLYDVQGTMTSKGTDHIFSGRFGGAAFANINQRNMVYLNGLMHVTHVPSTNGKSRFIAPDEDIDRSETIKIKGETAIGPDIAVGYVHRFTDKIGLDVRYRAIVYFPVSGPRDFDDPRVNHGINAGLTFNF